MAEGDAEWRDLVNQSPEEDIQNLEEDDVEDEVKVKVTEDEPEARLSRFLYLGKEYASYQPGYWFVHNYFLMKNVPSIEELASSKELQTQLLPIEVIKKAFESNLVSHPEILVFALAVCCKQDKSIQLRQEAYKSIKTICASPQNFILFIKFFSKLSRERELNYVTHGWGSGLRKAITDWYDSKEPLDLAKYVTRYKSRYGWKHKDIMKMSHLKITDPERGVIMKYIMHGMKRTRESLADKNDDDNINKILEHIQGVEDFKHCEDEIQAAAILERYELSLDHVPGHLLKAKEVWNSLIPSMEITTLLQNLQRINNLGILKSDEPAVDKVTNQLDAEYIVSKEIHPALLLITLRNYEKSGKPLSHEKRKVVQTARKQQPSSNPNPKIIDALKKAFSSSFAHLQATNLRYMVTIETTKSMDNLAWQGGHVTAFEAACLIAMILLRCENTENVTVASFKSSGIHLYPNVSKLDVFEDIKLKLKKNLSSTDSALNNPILWATEQEKKYDIFINIVSQITEAHDGSQNALVEYRNKLELPETKLINCAFCSPSSYRQKIYDKKVLTINGFDATVPFVIQAFVQSLF